MPAVVVLACLGIAACGGSGSSSTVRVLRPTQATKASFVAQVNSICTRADNAFVAAKTPKGKVSVIQSYIGVFKGVKVPSDLQADYARYVSVLTQELADLKHNDSSGLVKLRDSQARPLAQKLGLTACIS